MVSNPCFTAKRYGSHEEGQFDAGRSVIRYRLPYPADMEPNIAAVGALVSDPARARILWALADGRGLPAGELARQAGVTPQTASSHLKLLADRGFIFVIPQGRHRYYRLANSRVARLLETMAGFAPELPPPASSRCEPELRQARSCYHHMAGHLAVVVTRAFVDHAWLAEDGLTYHLTSKGESGFSKLGIDLPRLQRSSEILARPCLDWSERRNHLAGSLGRAVFDCFLEQQWVRRVASSRVIQLTDLGRKELPQHLGLKSTDI